MIKKIAVAVGLACLSSSAWAVDYGDYAQVTVDRLIHDYPGRYRGTDNFAGAADWPHPWLSNVPCDNSICVFESMRLFVPRYRLQFCV